jgi:protein-disulfide isomerase
VYDTGVRPAWPLGLSILGVVVLLGCRTQTEAVTPDAELERLRAEQQELRTRLEAAEARAADEQSRREETSARLQQLVDRVGELERGTERRFVPPKQPDPEKRYRVDLGHAHARGSADALVTIVEWASFQCGFSNRVQNTLRVLEARYRGDLRIVFKHHPLPMHERAHRAAMVAEAAGLQGKFWEMHDQIWMHQRELNEENFVRWAKLIGLDMPRFRRDVDAPGLADRVRRDEAQAQALLARGTPAFFINGRFLSGAQPVESFARLIDEELATAADLVARGTPRERVYETLMRQAVPPGS